MACQSGAGDDRKTRENKPSGWEKKTTQSLPIQSWNLMRPWVVSASKSGATVPKRILFVPCHQHKLIHGLRAYVEATYGVWRSSAIVVDVVFWGE